MGHVSIEYIKLYLVLNTLYPVDNENLLLFETLIKFNSQFILSMNKIIHIE